MVAVERVIEVRIVVEPHRQSRAEGKTARLLRIGSRHALRLARCAQPGSSASSGCRAKALGEQLVDERDLPVKRALLKVPEPVGSPRPDRSSANDLPTRRVRRRSRREADRSLIGGVERNRGADEVAKRERFADALAIAAAVEDRKLLEQTA